MVYLQQIQINFDFHLSLTNGLLTTNTDHTLADPNPNYIL
jgi:hypothetical protein